MSVKLILAVIGVVAAGCSQEVSQKGTDEAGSTNVDMVEIPAGFWTNKFEVTLATNELPRVTYFVSIPGGPCGSLLFKTRPKASRHLGRIDALGGIGATVWTEDEWREATNRLAASGAFFTNVIDLTPHQTERGAP